MIFVYDNKINSVGPSSERIDFRFSDAFNDPRLSRRGRTVTATDEWLLFNLGSADKVKYCIISGHNLNTGATVMLSANNANDWTDPPYSVEIDVEDVMIKKIDEEYQFWRLTFSGVTKDFIEISKVYLSEGVEGPGMEQSQILSTNTNSEYSKSTTMQIYGDRRTQYKSAEIMFPLVSEEERKNIKTMFAAVDIVQPFFLLFWENNLDVEPPLYCNFLEPPSFERVFNEGGVYWTYTMSIEECK